MKTEYIPPEAWRQLEEKHSTAYHYLLRESLLGERKALQRELEIIRRQDALREENEPRRLYIIRRLRELEIVS